MPDATQNALTAKQAALAAPFVGPLSASAVLASAALSWRVTDSNGTWLELLVQSRPDGAAIVQSVVLVEEHASGWVLVGDRGQLSETDARELLADVAKWACGAKGTLYFELVLKEAA